MWHTLNTGAPFEVIPRLRSGLLRSQLGVYVWVSWSSPRPRGHPEVSRPLVPAACWVREGGERVFCVGVPYITRFLFGSFFLRPSPSTLPSMRCLPFSSVLFQLSMFGRGLRCFDFANQMHFRIILLVGCCFTCNVRLLSRLSLSFSVFLYLSLSFSVFLSLSVSLFRSLSLSPSLPFSVLLCPSLSLCLSVPMQALLQEELEALETQRSSLRKVGGCWF